MTFIGGLGLIFAWFAIMWGFRIMIVLLAIKTAQNGFKEVKKGGKV